MATRTTVVQLLAVQPPYGRYLRLREYTTVVAVRTRRTTTGGCSTAVRVLPKLTQTCVFFARESFARLTYLGGGGESQADGYLPTAATVQTMSGRAFFCGRRNSPCTGIGHAAVNPIKLIGQKKKEEKNETKRNEMKRKEIEQIKKGHQQTGIK